MLLCRLGAMSGPSPDLLSLEGGEEDDLVSASGVCVFLKQGFAVKFRLALDLLQSFCLRFPSDGMTGVALPHRPALLGLGLWGAVRALC